MDALIQGWRLVWKMGDFPFYYVQLAPYNYAYNREYAHGRRPRFPAPAPHLGGPVATPCASPTPAWPSSPTSPTSRTSIPANKQDVGYRLSLWARAKVYGEKTLVYSGPLYKSMAVDGNLIRLSFDHVGGGLIANDGQPLKWFEIAGEDRIFYKAEAEDRGRHGRRLEPARPGAEGGAVRLAPAGRAQPGQQGRPARLALPHRQVVAKSGTQYQFPNWKKGNWYCVPELNRRGGSTYFLISKFARMLRARGLDFSAPGPYC